MNTAANVTARIKALRQAKAAAAAPPPPPRPERPPPPPRAIELFEAWRKAVYTRDLPAASAALAALQRLAQPPERRLSP